MKNTEELPVYHKEIIADIGFLKSELGFLLKILRNCYSSDSSLEKIKLMDAFWKQLEESIAKLNLLLATIQKEDFYIDVLYKDGLIDVDRIFFGEEKIQTQFKEIVKEVKTLKENYYEFMNSHNLLSSSSK